VKCGTERTAVLSLAALLQCYFVLRFVRLTSASYLGRSILLTTVLGDDRNSRHAQSSVRARTCPRCAQALAPPRDASPRPAALRSSCCYAVSELWLFDCWELDQISTDGACEKKKDILEEVLEGNSL
jgi:hypothetical protein